MHPHPTPPSAAGILLAPVPGQPHALFGKSMRAAAAGLKSEASPPGVASDAELLDLGRHFEAAWAQERAIPKPPKDADPLDASRIEFDRAVLAAGEVIGNIATLIARIPATTLAGLLVKARAVSWCMSGDPVADMLLDLFDCLEVDLATDAKLVVGILRDLEAIAELPAAAARAS